MSIPPTLQPADEIWGELRRHFEWSRGFSLFFLFGRLRATALIRDRLTDALRFRSLPLQRIDPDNAEEAYEQIVERRPHERAGYRADREREPST